MERIQEESVKDTPRIDSFCVAFEVEDAEGVEEDCAIFSNVEFEDGFSDILKKSGDWELGIVIEVLARMNSVVALNTVVFIRSSQKQFLVKCRRLGLK